MKLTSLKTAEVLKKAKQMGKVTSFDTDWDIDKSGKFASACGALCTTQVGNTDSIKNSEETLAFMESADLLD